MHVGNGHVLIAKLLNERQHLAGRDLAIQALLLHSKLRKAKLFTLFRQIWQHIPFASTQHKGFDKAREQLTSFGVFRLFNRPHKELAKVAI
jgi:hypothetical protein